MGGGHVRLIYFLDFRNLLGEGGHFRVIYVASPVSKKLAWISETLWVTWERGGISGSFMFRPPAVGSVLGITKTLWMTCEGGPY